MKPFFQLMRQVIAKPAIVGRVPQWTRAATQRVKSALIGPWHALPDFLIVGAMKSGTSLLYWLMSQHPQVLACKKKEVWFFDKRYDCGLNWYRNHFPRKQQLRQRFRQTGLPSLTGEASPHYISHPQAPRRIARHLADVKIIMLLRDPVQRTISDYHHMARLGMETLPLDQAIALEPQRLAGEYEKMCADERYFSAAFMRHAHIARSVYIDQVLAYHRHFPRERVLILRSEDLFADPISTLWLVHDFLGLQRSRPANVVQKNKGTYAAPDPILVERLRSYFRPHNQRLYEHLGVDFGWE